jgi:hypothetical protein
MSLPHTLFTMFDSRVESFNEVEWKLNHLQRTTTFTCHPQGP